MPNKEEIIGQIDWLTERMSNRVWTISVGVLATSLAYIIESTKKEGEPFLEPRIVAIPAAIALLALLADLIQYYAAGQQNIRLLKQMEKDGDTEMAYDTKSLAFRVRVYAYYTKIYASMGAVAWLVFVSIRRVLELL